MSLQTLLICLDLSSVTVGVDCTGVNGIHLQSQLHTQWLGTGVCGDPIFDAFESGFMPLTFNATRQETSMRAAGYELLSLIDHSFLISHSSGAIYGILLSNECLSLVAANVNLEPGNIAFQYDIGNTFTSAGLPLDRPYSLTVTNVHYDPLISDPTELATETLGVDTPGNCSYTQQSTTPGNVIHTLPNVVVGLYVEFTGQASLFATYK